MSLFDVITDLAMDVFIKASLRSEKRAHRKPFKTQNSLFKKLIRKGRKTHFGKDHNFDQIKNYEDFKKHVPIRDYEKMRDYFVRTKDGEANVLWPGKPLYLALTSGTTSGKKLIPVTKASIRNVIKCGFRGVIHYLRETRDWKTMQGWKIVLQGSPELDSSGPIPMGRMTGIIHYHINQRRRLPSYDVNVIDDWEKKIDAIIDEAMEYNITGLSGIPPWVQNFMDRLLERTGKSSVKEVFPNLKLFIYGGVNFTPYRKQFMETAGLDLDVIEFFPASEGFFAYQDQMKNKNGLLLAIDTGIFFEFVPVNEIHNENPTRLSIRDVELGVNYAMIINTNAGLWGYNMGDTVQFTSLSPHRIVVTGRVKHYTSAFGEHVIGEEVDNAMHAVSQELNIDVIEFHVAPQISPKDSDVAYHEWFVECKNDDVNLDEFGSKLDASMNIQNTYYKDLRDGNMLSTIKVRKVKENSFRELLESRGQVDAQNKVPRLANDRKIADQLESYIQANTESSNG